METKSAVLAAPGHEGKDGLITMNATTVTQDVTLCALLLDAADPRRVLYRTSESILAPDTPAERLGVVPNVIFPTGVDPRPDGKLDIYYGMADSRIGVARASLPELLAPKVAAAA